MKQIVIVADLQVPYHDPRYVMAVKNYLDAVRPDEVGQIGDLIDLPTPSRWSRGTAREYEPVLQKHIEDTKRMLDVFEFDWVKTGNHDRRVEDYVRKYAPALSSLDALRCEELFGLRERKVRFERDPFTVAPGWIAAHGDEGTYSSIGGRTALGLGRRWDRSVICGHTHRAGIVSETVGFQGRYRSITGFEVGNGMLTSAATYIKSGTPNWQQAFGVLWVDGKHVTPELIPVVGGRFIVNGKSYSS